MTSSSRKNQASKNIAWLRLIAVLSLSLVVVASAEVADGSHYGIGQGGGRSFVNPNGSVNNLQSILSSCAVGRPGGAGGVGGVGGAPANQSSIGFDNGILQASVPDGAPGGTGVGVASAVQGSASAPNGASLFQTKCLSCHNPSGAAAGKPITAGKGAIRVADKTMPPPGSAQANSLQDADRAAIAAFLPSLGR